MGCDPNLLFSMRTVSVASLQCYLSVGADAWCKRALRTGRQWYIKFVSSEEIFMSSEMYGNQWPGFRILRVSISGSRGSRGPCRPPPPSPVKTSGKKDGRWRWPIRFHVSCQTPPPGRWIRYWEYTTQGAPTYNFVHFPRKTALIWENSRPWLQK